LKDANPGNSRRTGRKNRGRAGRVDSSKSKHGNVTRCRRSESLDAERLAEGAFRRRIKNWSANDEIRSVDDCFPNFSFAVGRDTDREPRTDALSDCARIQGRSLEVNSFCTCGERDVEPIVYEHEHSSSYRLDDLRHELRELARCQIVLANLEEIDPDACSVRRKFDEKSHTVDTKRLAVTD
jgi:hypothetical protein